MIAKKFKTVINVMRVTIAPPVRIVINVLIVLSALIANIVIGAML